MLERKDSLGDERPDYVIRHGEVIFPELDDILANSVGLGVAFPRIVSPIELGGIVGYVNWKINENSEKLEEVTSPIEFFRLSHTNKEGVMTIEAKDAYDAMMTMKNTPHLADETKKTEVQIIEGQEPKDLKHRHLPPNLGIGSISRKSSVSTARIGELENKLAEQEEQSLLADERYEEGASIARGGEEQLDMVLDMKTFHGRAREEREACAREEDQVQASAQPGQIGRHAGLPGPTPGPTGPHAGTPRRPPDPAPVPTGRVY
ncbi:hypothetical protein QYE76_059778 [Lolium multiflorum]|uniref:Uncharacterized protein n=1 Tax=Lolium multiflorum TaxID=4521 RepID=A0AAD8W3M7_LOLMU|nr:hypothetical protein QYE76_059778 [Lolium multiflorum]